LANFGRDKEKSISKLNGLYPDLKNNSAFLTTYGKALSLSEYYPEAVAILERAVERQSLSVSYIELGKCYEASGLSEKAFVCWEQASRTVPSRFTPLYLTMKLHFKNNEYSLAKEFAGQILKKKIKIDNPEIDGMKQEAKEVRNFHPP
jgi:tetratricopeptide (TPR) repeat protein